MLAPHVRRGLLLSLLGALGFLLGAPRAAAQILPPFDIHARYEEELIADALKRLSLEVDPAPLGKTIERILVEPYDIFLPGFDPVPGFFNMFHVTTRPYIVRQELLFKEGDAIGPDTLTESERNLRSLFVLAVTRIVTARGSTPEKVVVVVVTKDLWTLRPNTDFVFENGNLDQLSFTLAEHNLAGRNKFLGLNFRLDPATWWVGEHYIDPRILTSRVAGDEQVLVIFNRDHGDAEGVLGHLIFGRPLYSLATEWGWDAGLAFEDDVARQFQNGQVRTFYFRDHIGIPVRYEYDQRLISSAVDVKRSFGREWKSNFTLGYRIDANRFTLEPGVDPAVADEFRQVILPFSEESAALFWRYDFFQPRYVVFQDIQAYAVTEDFRLGPQATLELDWAASEFGFSSDFLRVVGEMGWRWLLHDDILYASLTAEARYEPHFVNPQGWTTPYVNRRFYASVENTSPRLGIFRLVTRAQVQLRDYDLSNAQLQLGATSGLRGFAAGTFEGSNVYLFNVELRTKPISLWTLYLGLAAFYDGGSAFYSDYGLPDQEYNGRTLAPAYYHQDVGIGLRGQLPQFNHFVVRFDLAFPIFEKLVTDPVVPSAAFGQAF